MDGYSRDAGSAAFGRIHIPLSFHPRGISRIRRQLYHTRRKKITDLRIVVPEIERTQQLVNESLGEIDMSLRTADSAFDDAVLADEDLSDPMVKDLILSTLEY